MFTKSSKRSLQRALGAERLEGRQPLAGDVGIALLGNQLVIEGDAEANALTVERSAGGGFDIRGSVLGDDATTINGGDEAFHVDSLDGNVLIDMGAGDDSLTLGGDGQASSGSLLANRNSFRLNGNLLANLGAGNDTFSANLAGRGDLTVMGGPGSDDIAVSGRVGSLTVIADGLNADSSGADSVQLSNLRARGDVNVFTMGGDDQIALSGDLRIQSNLTIDSGEGADQVSLAASRFVVRGEVSIDPPTDTGTTGENADTASIAGEHSAAMGDASAIASLTTDLTNPIAPTVAFGNALLNADPVGAGNVGLALTNGAFGGNSGLTAASSLIADAALTPAGALVNGALDPANSLNRSLLDNTALANLTAPVGSVLASDLLTGMAPTDTNALQTALLPNTAALPPASNPLGAAATDRVFNQFDESQLIGSAARNATFLSNFSQDPTLNTALNQLALARSFAPLF